MEATTSEWAAWAWSLLAGALALLTAVLAHQWWHLRHFVRRGLPCERALPFVGNMGPLVLRRLALAEMAQKLYEARGAAPSETPVVGFFEFAQPIMVVRDPAVLRDICVKQFDHFRNHRAFPLQKHDPIFSSSLFAVRDQRWKDMRATLSPAFTASKMRAVFNLVSECGRQSADFLENKCKTLPKDAHGVYEVEFKDFFTRFATDVIATSAFGLHCDSFEQPNNDFYLMGKEITYFGGIKGILMILYTVFPAIAKVLGVSFFGKKAEVFFRSLIHDALTQRTQRGIYRPDVLQLMMEARDGRLGPQVEGAEQRFKMTENDITAQAVLFFFAGFDTISNLICFVCYFLALNPDVQERLQKEVDETLATNGGQLDYDVLQRMKYLDMVINETLRMYPPAPAVDRECAENVELPLSGGRAPLCMRKGDILWVPIMGLQRDPRYWENPDKFDPERFSDANKANITPFTYLPFGVGPRVCLAQRFALLEAKVALVHVVHRVALSRVARTSVPIRLARVGFNTASADGYWCGVSLRTPATIPVGVAA